MDSTVRVELLWFEGCPNHAAAEALTRDVIGTGYRGTDNPD